MMIAVSVKKYHNYPKAMVGDPTVNNKPSTLFYFCFFEMSNGRKIGLHTYKSYNKKIDIYNWNTFMTVNKQGEDVDLGEYSDYYADEYNFGEDFSDWFNRSHTIPPKTVTEYPTDEEYKCVIDYYEKHIKPKNN